MILLAAALSEAGRSLPPGATAVDHVFAVGAVLLLIGLIVWSTRFS